MDKEIYWTGGTASICNHQGRHGDQFITSCFDPLKKCVRIFLYCRCCGDVKEVDKSARGILQ